MTFFRRGRFWYWIIKDLAAKYTRAWGLGLLLGSTIAVSIWYFTPRLYQFFFAPVERYGVVGDFTPTNLPLSIQQLVSHGLTTITEDGTIAPDLASSWEATDGGKTYYFRLRSDRVWHSGKPVIATDVNYNIRDVRLSAIDDTTLRVDLTAPFSPFPTLVSKPLFQKGLQGFGPYRVATIQLKGDTVQYLKLEPVNTPTLPTKVYRFYRTEAVALLAFRLGEIDILEDISTSHDFALWKDVSVIPRQMNNRIVTIFFNLNDPLLRDKNVRQALGYALPEFPGDRAFSPIPRTSWAYTENIRSFKRDLPAVKRLMQNSAKSTDSGQLTVTTFSQYLDVAQKIIESWNSVGIQASVRVENVVPSDYQVLLTAQDVPLDPDQYPLWHSTQKQTNITGYVNVKIDKLLEDGRLEQDPEKRKKIYEEFQRYLVDDAPALFLYHPTSYSVKRGKQ